MKSASADATRRPRVFWIVHTCLAVALCATVYASVLLAAEGIPVKESQLASAPSSANQKGYGTPQEAADALVAAAAAFDTATLRKIFGPGGEDIFLSGEPPLDRQRAVDFADLALEKRSIAMDPQSADRAFLIVGTENWPFPVPIVKRKSKWSFDTEGGRQELLNRRIGANELDAIRICRGYVEAQYEYSFEKHEGNYTNQYAQRMISTPGKRDGLAWQSPEGTWSGPVGEKVARAIAQGYSSGEAYHGYFFKILKGQGPAAPHGAVDFVVGGVMIGGFALAAAPAEYGVTGVKTFIVSHDGVVYERDFGRQSLQEFAKMERYNPDETWTAVP